MTYTDLAHRLEDLDNKLLRNEREATTTTSLISRLETQLENAKKKQRNLRSARVALLDQRDSAKRELNVRLG
jgi:chromosome segregation ATPase